MPWLTNLKNNLLLIMSIIIAGLLVALKYMSKSLELKETQVEKIKKSIDTAVEVNKTNEVVRTTQKEVADVKDSVKPQSDDDVDSVLLNKYTRGRHKN